MRVPTRVHVVGQLWRVHGGSDGGSRNRGRCSKGSGRPNMLRDSARRARFWSIGGATGAFRHGVSRSRSKAQTSAQRADVLQAMACFVVASPPQPQPDRPPTTRHGAEACGGEATGARRGITDQARVRSATSPRMSSRTVPDASAVASAHISMRTARGVVAGKVLGATRGRRSKARRRRERRERSRRSGWSTSCPGQAWGTRTKRRHTKRRL